MGFWSDLAGRLFGGPPRTDEAESESDETLPEVVTVTDDLDLHGLFPEQVPEMLDEFLHGARDLGIAEVRIAHGKGKSVLRRVVWEILERHPLVAGFGAAPPERGGWGATIARLVPKTGGRSGEPD